jgi:hypothetical protein
MLDVGNHPGDLEIHGGLEALELHFGLADINVRHESLVQERSD